MLLKTFSSQLTNQHFINFDCKINFHYLYLKGCLKKIKGFHYCFRVKSDYKVLHFIIRIPYTY